MAGRQYSGVEMNSDKWQLIATAPREPVDQDVSGPEVLLCDDFDREVYVGYFRHYRDIEVDGDAGFSDYVIAGETLATRKLTRGFWYTAEDYAIDGEYGAIGDGRKSPKFWKPLPSAPTSWNEVDR